MQYLENDFAQIEHINQTIANNLTSMSWDCFDTEELLKQYPQFGVYSEGNSYITFPTGESAKTLRGETITSYKGIRYNSFIVDIERKIIDDIVYWQYTFEVRNTLWDGEYKISQSRKINRLRYHSFSEGSVTKYTGYEDENKNDTTTNKNVLRILIKGEQGNNIRVCFHMSMASDSRYIEVTPLDLELESGTEYTHPYNKTIYEKGTLSLQSGEIPKGIDVILWPCDKFGRVYSTELIKTGRGRWIPPHTLSDVGTEFNMPYGPTSVPGVYYCIMKVVSKKNKLSSTNTRIIKVNKIRNDKAKILWGDDSLYDNIYKGCKHKYRVMFNLFDQFGDESDDKEKIIGLPVNITFIKSSGKRIPYTSTIQYDSDKKEYYAEATISYRGYYDEYSKLEVELSSDYGYGRVINQRIIKHPWFIADNYYQLENQLWLTDLKTGKYVDKNGNNVTTPVENDMGTDWIFLRGDNAKGDGDRVYNVKRTLNINRDITIASLTGKHKAVLEVYNSKYASGYSGDIGNFSSTISIIKTNNDEPSKTNMLKVNLIGLTFKGAQSAIQSGAGTRLLIDKCYFTDNHNKAKHHRGCSLYIPDDDWSVKNKDLWLTEIRSSYFKNNKGNEIQSVGKTKITGNLFVTDNKAFLQQPEVKVVTVRAGSVEYTFNKSYINSGKKPMPSNHSYAKALAYVERGGTFNGKGPNQLGGDMKLPLYGTPWNNEAYTYSIYYYPYSNVRTEIVCSPRRGYERKATGHSSSYTNWVYYDGYYFLRWEKGRNTGNLKDPWTKKELSVPNNLGIYTELKDKFETDYDPRFSNAKSTTLTIK